MNYFNYFSEIEAAFIRRRGHNLLLSPVDWELIESWKEKEIPLHIIVRAIEDVFDAYDKKPTKRKIKSLSYCKDEIEAQHTEWLEAQIGKSKAEDSLENIGEKVSESEVFSNASIETHIARVIAEFESAISVFSGETFVQFEMVLNNLKAVKTMDVSAQKLEGQLEEFDKNIDEILLMSEKADAAKGELVKKMSEYKTKMDEEAFARTFGLMLQKQLREVTGIPRFSLFYL